MGNPPLLQDRACSTVKEALHSQYMGVREGDHPYRRARATKKAPLCRQIPNSSIGKDVNQFDAPFSLAKSIDCPSAWGWRGYAHTYYYHFAFQCSVSNSFRNIPNCSRGHGGCSAASLGMLSQSRLQRQRLQRCRIYPQVGDKSHWNSRERVLEPEELPFLQATDK